jgi:hypothetical protein
MSAFNGQFNAVYSQAVARSGTWAGDWKASYLWPHLPCSSSGSISYSGSMYVAVEEICQLI